MVSATAAIGGGLLGLGLGTELLKGQQKIQVNRIVLHESNSLQWISKLGPTLKAFSPSIDC